MTRFYVPLDVNYQTDDKIIAARPMGECLYVRSLAYAKRIGSEGRIHRNQLRVLALGLPGRPDKHARTLVDAGLWEDTPDGWAITGWLKHNPTNRALAEQRSKIQARSIAGNHKRHHVDKGVVDDDCQLCQTVPQGSAELPTRDEKRSHARSIEDEDKTKRKEDEQTTTSSDPPHPAAPPATQSSSSVDQIVATTALAIALKDREHPARSYINGIAKNLRRERLNEIETCITQGLSVHDAAIRLDADPWFVSKALNGSTP